MENSNDNVIKLIIKVYEDYTRIEGDVVSVDIKTQINDLDKISEIAKCCNEIIEIIE